MKIDNEFKNLIPPLTEDEYKQLEENILRDGIRDPLVVWSQEEILVDGHNRYEIAQKHNLPFATKSIDFEDRNEAMAWIIRNQFGRRNLNKFQRSELSIKLKKVISARAKKQQGARTDILQNSAKSSPIDTRKEIAKIARVSHDTIDKVGYVLDKGSEETKQLARSGKISTNEAYKRTVKENMPPKPDIPSVKEEHEAFKETKKSSQVVTMEAIEADKDNQRIIALDMSLRLLKAAEAFEKLTLTTNLTEIKEDTSALTADEKEHLITQMRSVRSCADGIIKTLGGI